MCLIGFDSDRQTYWFMQEIPPIDTPGWEDLERAHWEHYWDCRPCSHPDRTGDLRSVLKIKDFYSARQWHSTGMYTDHYRPQGYEHELQLCLPEGSPWTVGPGRTIRLYFLREPGPDFPSGTGRCSHWSGRICTRPTWTPSGAATPFPGLPPAERPAAPDRGRAHQHPDRPPARHLRKNRAHPPGNIYERLHVSSRTAAVTRAFADRAAS
jgi:hypothetical protein